MEGIGRGLIALGLVLLGLGLIVLHGGAPLGLGRLPGDLRIERPGFQLYLPLTSGLLVSALLSGALWLLSRWR